jgi:anaphase-promoting complex subunit 3
MTHRSARMFPDEAALRCRSGTMALRGNLPDKASLSFRQALALNPMLWEAFEGLCALGMSPPRPLTGQPNIEKLGSIPEIDELFPPRPPPTKRTPPEDPQPKPTGPIASGAGFFTPDTGNAGNLFCERRHNQLPFRMPAAPK